MKSEKEIEDKLGEYQWYYNMIIETEVIKGFIESLKWVLLEEN